MQHDLVRVESLAAWCLDVRDGRRELKLILGSVLEDTNLVATYNKRPVVLVANRQLRVLVSVRGASLDVVFRLVRVVVLASLLVRALILVLFFLLFLFWLFIWRILHGQVLEGFQDVLSIRILCLAPFDLVQVLPQSLHHTLLNVLEAILILEL